MVAVTGIILIAFVIGHLVGNLQFFGGPHLINAYGTKLRDLPFAGLWIVRIGLLAAVVLHIATTILLVIENRAAKGAGYVKKASVQAKIATRLMALSGILLLSYIVFHILHFTTHTITPDYSHWKDHEDHDVYRMIVAAFSNRLMAIIYIVAMVLLAMHLSHGAASLFQTLGLRTKKLANAIGLGAQIFAWAICLGYVSIPVAVMAGFYDKKHIAEASEPSCCGTEAPTSAAKEAK